MQVEICEPDGLKDRKIMEVHPDVILIDMDQSRGRGLKNYQTIPQATERTCSCHYGDWQHRFAAIPGELRGGWAMYFFDRVREQDWLIDSLASIREQLT